MRRVLLELDSDQTTGTHHARTSGCARKSPASRAGVGVLMLCSDTKHETIKRTHQTTQSIATSSIVPRFPLHLSIQRQRVPGSQRLRCTRLSQLSPLVCKCLIPSYHFALPKAGLAHSKKTLGSSASESRLTTLTAAMQGGIGSKVPLISGVGCTHKWTVAQALPASFRGPPLVASNVTWR